MTSHPGQILMRATLARRRRKCQQAGTHASGRCRSCGVHQ